MAGHRIIGVFFYIFLCSCMELPDQDAPASAPDWLEGKWIQDTRSESPFTEEWTKHSPFHYAGKGYKLKQGDTLFSEQVDIQWVDSNYHYIVTGVHPKPMHFVFTTRSNNHFVCEHPTNDFPQSISYTRTGNRLMVVLSNNDQSDTLFLKRSVGR